MATARMTVGSISTGIVNAANAVGETFDIIGNGARYANNFTRKALREQELTHAYDEERFEQKLEQRFKMEIAEDLKVIDAYKADPNNADRYEEAERQFASIKERVAKKRSGSES